MNARTTILAGMILLAALSRLIPHPPNFTALTALTLFGAAHLNRKWTAFLVPWVALLLSDLGLEVLYQLGLSASWGFYRSVWVIYATLALIAAMGLWLRGRVRLLPVGAMTLASSVVFFVITNFAVWAASTDAPFPAGYPKTFAGLVDCYVMALPFFGWTLLGDALFATVFFGGFALAQRTVPTLRLYPEP